jgi:hypothetical protein
LNAAFKAIRPERPFEKWYSATPHRLNRGVDFQASTPQPGINDCCVKRVLFPPASKYAMFASPAADWTTRLTAGLSRIIKASDQSSSHREEKIRRQTRGLECQLLLFPHSTHAAPNVIEMRRFDVSASVSA